jgi:hypothetical protein
MSLVESSTPGMDRDRAIRLLTERAVLTRAFCREVTEAGDGLGDPRQCIALSLLLRWIVENLPESLQYRAASGNLCQDAPRASHGIDLMVVPGGCEGVLREIRDGAQVGDALLMLMTADNPIQARGDEAVIRERLAAIGPPTLRRCGPHRPASAGPAFGEAGPNPALHPTRPRSLFRAAPLLVAVCGWYRGRAGELIVRPQRRIEVIHV